MSGDKTRRQVGRANEESYMLVYMVGRGSKWPVKLVHVPNPDRGEPSIASYNGFWRWYYFCGAIQLLCPIHRGSFS